MDASETFSGYAWRLMTVIILVFANGFFVATEFALVGVRRSRIEALASAGNRSAKRLLGLLDDLTGYLSASQLGITLASLGLGWVGEPAVARLLELPLSGRVSDPVRRAIAFAVGFTLITVLHIVLGEQSPKLLGLEKAERVALAIAWPIQIFYRVFRWPILALDSASVYVVRLLGLHARQESPSTYSQDELRKVIELSHKGGQIKQSQRAILARALEFSGLTARAVMVPRPEVEAISESMSLDEILARIRESGYSRLPVYRETLDDVVGLIHSKEILAYWHNRDAFSIAAVLHPPVFIPDSMRLDGVLRTMQEGHFHFGIVTDEHGGVEGIITLEDLLEEIVGEIEDEFDVEIQQHIRRRPDGSYSVDGAAPVRVVNQKLSMQLPEDEIYNTIAGFLMARSGRVLREGDTVRLDDAEFVVEKADRHRIRTVRVLLDSHAPVGRSD
jgi:CBS domain containing-hemolysin-like protein